MMARQIGYGAFPGGDPRTFTPDPECSTEQEREAHRRACAIYEAHGKLPAMDPDYQTYGTEGPIFVHIARSRFGLGTYEYDDGEPEGEPDRPPDDAAWDDEVLRDLDKQIREALAGTGTPGDGEGQP